jgi:hypothetical protein
MENAPIIHLASRSPAPGADATIYKRYVKWTDEAYFPIQNTIPEAIGNYRYLIVRENPEYGSRASVHHFKNLRDWGAYMVSSDSKAIQGEVKSWQERGITDQIWSAAYAMVKSFRNKPAFESDNQDTRIENAPIMHLEAYRMSPEEQEIYLKWFNDFGYPVFMPLFMKLPGVAGYDWYRDTGQRAGHYAKWEYAPYLAIMYFENLDAFENFARSSELAGFQKSIRSVIPRRLEYIWYVQYQLDRSWRK